MTRRGLTLIEVLAATVLLSLIAATCLPLMQRATRDLSAAPVRPTWDLVELQDLMQLVAEDPLVYGVEMWPPIETSINWPDAGSRPPIQLRRAHETTDSVWLEASCEGHRVFVWAALPDEPEATP